MADDKTQTPTPAPAQREAARRRAQNHFAASEQRDNDVRKEIQREQEATAKKTAKLRALRLEKEAAERIADANKPAAPKARKAPARRPRTVS